MMTPQALDVEQFATAQLKLLATELDAELSSNSALLSLSSPRALARAGAAVLSLTVTAQRTGLGGKTVLELGLDGAVSSGDGADLPEHGVRAGDIVRVAEQPKGNERKKEVGDMKKKGAEGVVVKVGRQGLSVALDGEGEETPVGRLWVVKLANDVTHKRMKHTMLDLQKSTTTSRSLLAQVLFGQSSPAPIATDGWKDLKFSDPTLNDSQKEAVRFALATPDVALIHGPPGTGKTHTLITLIHQLAEQGKRILVCGPSNISVDNIVERLALTHPTLSIVRLGHPARLLPSVVAHSLDNLTHTSDAAALVADVRRDLDVAQRRITKTRNGRERKDIYGEMRELRKEYRVREQRCVADIVHGSRVVLATLHGAGGYQLRGEKFDVLIVDEASQALEAQCWIPLGLAGKLVLAGDHLQLPPTVKSLDGHNEKKGLKTTDKDGEKLSAVAKVNGVTLSLATTLFDRLLTLHGPGIKRMLTVQYRMHEKICAFPSDELYDSKLTCAPAVRIRLLCDLDGVSETEDTSVPLVFYDTQGGEYPEKDEDDDSTREDAGKKHSFTGMVESKCNEGEGSIVQRHVQSLVGAGVKEEDIAIVTPYNAQRALLGALLKSAYPALELSSVDGFQGREKEAIILSLVRSNSSREVGFLAEKRRLNVAMTRPRRHLCVIGDAETLASAEGGGFLKRWIAFLEAEADLRYP